ncbi:MAG: dual specificity protein phosphatase [Rudaea sp.]|nr:dual specificity protein phosphatase [Rudaea sp.]
MSYFNGGSQGFVMMPPDRISRFAQPWLRYICIAGVSAASDADELRHHGVTHVYTLMSANDPDLVRLLRRLAIPQRFTRVDDEERVDIIAVARRLYPQMERDRRSRPDACILVHCRAGWSRSASTLLYHLMRSWRMPLRHAWRMPLRHAWRLLKEARPVADPNNGFRAQLHRWDQQQQEMRYLCGLEAAYRLDQRGYTKPRYEASL